MPEIIGKNSHSDIGIDEVRLSNSIEELKGNIEDIKLAFNTIEKIVDDSNTFLQGEVGNAFRNKASNLIYCFSTIENNLYTYVDDLTNFLSDYQSFESNYTVSDN